MKFFPNHCTLSRMRRAYHEEGLAVCVQSFLLSLPGQVCEWGGGWGGVMC
jgi:hypothetical protein